VAADSLYTISSEYDKQEFGPMYKSSSKNGGAGNAAWRSTSMLGEAKASETEEAERREQKSAVAVDSRPDFLDMLKVFEVAVGPVIVSSWDVAT